MYQVLFTIVLTDWFVTIHMKQIITTRAINKKLLSNRLKSV